MGIFIEESSRGYHPGKRIRYGSHLRLSMPVSVSEVADGLARIKWALDPMRRERSKLVIVKLSAIVRNLYRRFFVLYY